jgi:hypothetical protein
MKTVGGSGDVLYACVISEADGGELSASCSGRFSPGGRAPGTRPTGSQSRYGHWEREKYRTLIPR